MHVHYEVIRAEALTDPIRRIFAAMLKKQGKVLGDLNIKSDRCKFIILAKVDGSVVAIGAIKPKSRSDFELDKAAIPDLEEKFEWEVGYVYTLDEYARQGIASNVVSTLLDAFGPGNLMASTESSRNPGMVRILEKHGFSKHGKTWKSQVHGQDIALFLRWKPSVDQPDPIAQKRADV